MPASEHPVFTWPTNLDVPIWRYMDFTKFMSILETKSLFFSRASLLGDPFEGSYSQINQMLRSTIYEGKIPPEGLQQRSQSWPFFINWTMINCWHLGDRESAAMWKLYSKSSEAIAIRSTFRKLQRVLPDNCYIGMIGYVDYSLTWIPEGNTFAPFLHKRDSFKHENEVRAIIADYPEKKILGADGESIVFDHSVQLVPGRYVSVDLNELIESIYVAPSAPEWYRTLVVQIAARYQVNKPIISSALDERPVF